MLMSSCTRTSGLPTAVSALANSSYSTIVRYPAVTVSVATNVSSLVCSGSCFVGTVSATYLTIAGGLAA